MSRETPYSRQPADERDAPPAGRHASSLKRRLNNQWPGPDRHELEEHHHAEPRPFGLPIPGKGLAHTPNRCCMACLDRMIHGALSASTRGKRQARPRLL